MPSDAEPSAKERLAWLAIQDNALLAQSFVAGMTPQEFANDRRTFYAVTRCLEIISEAARRLRGAQQDRFPQIEWRQVEDSGNIFRHVYQHVAESRVWMTVEERLPALLAAANTALEGPFPGWSEGPIALWHGVTRAASSDHDIVDDDP
jgi:uncharacterized protein with HEPN domain